MNEEWLQAPAPTLPNLTRSHEDGGANLLGDNDGMETSERRTKLNILKNKRCSDARKKV